MTLMPQEFSVPAAVETVVPSIPSLHYTTTDGVHYSRRLHGKERFSAANSQNGIGFAQIIAIGDLELKCSLSREEFEPFVREAWLKIRHLCPWSAVRTSSIEAQTGEPNSFMFTYEKPMNGDLSLVEKWANETIVWRTESLSHAEWEAVFKQHYWKPADGRYSLELHVAKNRDKDRWIVMLSGPHWLTDGRGLFPVYDQFFRYLQSTLDGSSPPWNTLPWGEEVTRLTPSAIEIVPDVGGDIAKPPPPAKMFTRPSVQSQQVTDRPENISNCIALTREQTRAFNLACRKHRISATSAINSLLILADLETMLRMAKEENPEQYAELLSQYESVDAFPVLVNIADIRNFVSPYWASLTGNTGIGGLVNLGFSTFHDMNLVRKCMQLGPDGTFIKNLGPQTFWKGLCADTQKLLREGSKVTPHMYHVNVQMAEDTSPKLRTWGIPPPGMVASSLGNLERLDWFTPFRPSVASQTPNTAFAIHAWHFGVRSAGAPAWVVHSWDYDGQLSINVQGSPNFHTEKAWDTYGDVLRELIEQLLSVKAVL